MTQSITTWIKFKLFVFLNMDAKILLYRSACSLNHANTNIELNVNNEWH